jgi:hypothetical protein
MTEQNLTGRTALLTCCSHRGAVPSVNPGNTFAGEFGDCRTHVVLALSGGEALDTRELDAALTAQDVQLCIGDVLQIDPHRMGVVVPHRRHR